MNKEFSVLLSVYINEKPNYFKLAIDSLLKQTLCPSQIVIVEDGPLSDELYKEIKIYEDKYGELFTVVKLKENVGLGAALNYGLAHVKYELVARMDTDDICYSDRFEKQIEFLIQNPDISVVGGSVQEFQSEPNDLGTFRILPSENSELISFSQFRTPLNHPTVIFRKSHILEIGSYKTMLYFEDFYLWVRLIMRGYKIHNLKDPVLHFRIGNDMIGRRSGIQYVKKEFKFLNEAYKIGFLKTSNYILSLIFKLPFRLLPKRFIVFIYKKLVRK